jgi:MFS family permease
MSKPPLFSGPFALVFLANFFHSLAFHLFMHFPGQLRAQGAEETQIGWVMATAAVTAVIARPFVGRVMDSMGRRPVALFGALVHLIACAGYLFAGEMGPGLFAVRVVHGVAEALLFSVMFTIAADLVPATRRTEGIAIFGLSGMLPLGLAGLIGDAVLKVGTYDDVFKVSILSALLAGLGTLPIRDSKPVGGLPPRGFFRAISSSELLPVWFAGLTFATAVASAFTFIKTFVLHTGHGTAGLFFSVYTVSAILLRVGFAWVPERVGLTRVLIPSMLCVTLGLVCLALSDHALYVAAAGALCGIGHGYAFPILSALAVTRARPAERGAAITVFTALFGVGTLAAPAFGAIEDAAGYPAMFGTAAGLCMLGALGFWAWDKPGGKHTAAAQA